MLPSFFALTASSHSFPGPRLRVQVPPSHLSPPTSPAPSQPPANFHLTVRGAQDLRAFRIFNPCSGLGEWAKATEKAAAAAPAGLGAQVLGVSKGHRDNDSGQGEEKVNGRPSRLGRWSEGMAGLCGAGMTQSSWERSAERSLRPEIGLESFERESRCPGDADLRLLNGAFCGPKESPICAMQLGQEGKEDGPRGPRCSCGTFRPPTSSPVLSDQTPAASTLRGFCFELKSSSTFSGFKRRGTPTRLFSLGPLRPFQMSCFTHAAPQTGRGLEAERSTGMRCRGRDRTQ